MEINNNVDLIFSYSKKGEEKFSKSLVPKDNYYDLSLEGLSIGEYNFEVSISGSKNKVLRSGSFTIINSQREKMNTIANYEKLSSINQNGNNYSLSNLDKLINKLSEGYKEKIKFHSEEKSKDIINYKWLIILLFFPFLEWIIRKNNGLL
jgi:hypothetical protein